MAQPTIPLYTYAEYLEALEASHIRLEFVDGLVYALAGGTPEHNRIVMRLTLLVGNQLVRPCEAFGPDQKIRAGGAAFFPDLSVICGEPQLAEGDRNAFTNPSIVFEVLSPSTAATDQTTKADRYKALTSLNEYVLIWQVDRRVQVHRRQGSSFTVVELGAADTFTLSTGVRIAVQDLYP